MTQLSPRRRSRKRELRRGFPEVLVDERDRHAALADGRRDAFHRAEPHVAAREDPRYARLEQVRIAFELPPSDEWDVGAGEHEAAAVACDLGRQPGRLRVGADE